MIAALAVVAATMVPSQSPALEGPASDADPGSIVGMIARVIPTVVAIHTRRVIPQSGAPHANLPPKIERAEGSGFIISADGFIATNKHVVSGAYDVSAVLHDGQVAEAKVVWESTVVDVAFLKIEVNRPLQAAVFARDGTLQLGKRVVAIGNPQGLGISASAGIVSALDRNLKQSPYDNYVQTDAAINYGNSGGPLFDLDGEVVGMNSILWTTGKDSGSEGLGFAIPAPDISFLIDQLKRYRRIRCGILGLRGQTLTHNMGEALGFPGYHGVIVASMAKGSAAERAGLALGDVITTFDGKPLADFAALNRAACLALDHAVTLGVWRGGKEMSLEAHTTEADDGTGESPQRQDAPPRFASARDLGMSLAPLNDVTRRKYHMGPASQGFVVVSVADSSEAEVAGLAPNDVIISLQMVPLEGNRPFDQVFAQYGRSGHRYVIALVQSSGGERWITLPVRLGGAP